MKTRISASEMTEKLRAIPGYVEAEEKNRHRTALARTLLHYRAEHGLSQKELGKMAGMWQPQIANLEAARGNPGFSTLERLADAMGMTVIGLFAPLTELPKRQTMSERLTEAVCSMRLSGALDYEHADASYTLSPGATKTFDVPVRSAPSMRQQQLAAV